MKRAKQTGRGKRTWLTGCLGLCMLGLSACTTFDKEQLVSAMDSSPSRAETARAPEAGDDPLDKSLQSVPGSKVEKVVRENISRKSPENSLDTQGAEPAREQKIPGALAGVNTRVDAMMARTLDASATNQSKQNSDGKSAFVANHMLVRFDADLTESEKSRMLENIGIQSRHQISKSAGVELLVLQDGISVLELQKRLSATRGVALAEPDYLVSVDRLPNDTSMANSVQWGLHNVGQNFGTDNIDIDAPQAWSVVTGSPEDVIAVIDSGINYTHPDLMNNVWVNPGEIAANGIDDDSNGYVDDIHGIDLANNDSDPQDDYGHGSHVAGIIAAQGDNGIGIAGVVWQTKVIACKSLNNTGSGATSSAVACLDYLHTLKTAKNINIILSNNSWGGGGYSAALYAAIEAHRNAGILFVASAGNDNVNTDITPHYPASYNLDNIISVAAIDADGALPSFSNYGANTVDIAAPGVHIHSTITADKYAYLDGTSMAAPHVSGILALSKSDEPGLGWAELRDRLFQHYKPLANLIGKMRYPGIPVAFISFRDNDNDGMNDKWESSNGLNPSDPLDATTDLDNDGLNNLQEYLAGADPRHGDTDNDGALDGEDPIPLNMYEQFDSDADGQGDNADTDDDNDGVPDLNDGYPLDATRWKWASNILYTFSGDSANEEFGSSVSDAGDVNGDGYSDLVVGAPNDDDHGENSGSVKVFSGFDGSILYRFDGDSASDQFGVSVGAAGDVNKDGYSDLVVGAHRDDINGTDSGTVQVFSGINGSILYTFTGDHEGDGLGVSVSSAGDVNKDGYPDLIVGASGDDSYGIASGSARIYSGADGSILYTFYGDSIHDYFGGSVSGAKDVNGDGYDDVIVGSSNDADYLGSARVFSGRDGGILYTFYGNSGGDGFGGSVSDAGDVNKDGYPDLIVGAMSTDRSLYNRGIVSSGSAYVFSGSDGSVLYMFHGDSADDLLGSCVSAAGDVNQDGYDDLVIGARLDDISGNNSGSARVFSGRDGSVLYAFTGDDPYDGLGNSISAVADVNGDGYSDLIIGARYDDNRGSISGSARVYSGKGLWNDNDVDGENDDFDANDDNDGAEDIIDLYPLDNTRAGDWDGDGSDSLQDNCPAVVNPDQANFDGDTEGNLCDGDDDNDGVLDNSDAFDFDASESMDTDGDGAGNNADNDDDNDGVQDGGDNCPLHANADQADTDNDGLPNACTDADDDNDGFSDGLDSFPLNKAASEDYDFDGNPDSWNLSCNLTCRATSGLALDNCMYVHNPAQYNFDGDTEGDACDSDDDNDGVPDAEDAFSFNPNESADSDYDGVGNNADSDDDNDGVPDGSDNCPIGANSDQRDTDSDGLGDACETDDQDGDWMPDSWELLYGTDPQVKDAEDNPDRDAATNYEEYVRGTDPLLYNDPTYDFDADGDADLLFQDAHGTVTRWHLENGYKVSSYWLNYARKIVLIAGRTLYHQDYPGDSTIYWSGMTDNYIASYGSNCTYWDYKLVTKGLITRDAYADFILENESGGVVLCRSEGSTVKVYLGAWAGHHVAGVADVDDDGDEDILTQDAGGNLNIIKMENGEKVSARWIGAWAGYKVVGAGDADGDGDDDIFMETDAGSVLVVVMENGVKQTARWIGAWSGNRIKGLGDIDKDGDVDLIQQNPANGSVQVVEIENAQKVTGRWLGTFAYTVKGVLDVDRDGDMDLAMQSASGGVALVVLEAGNKVGGARWLGSNTGTLLLFP